MTGTTDAGLPRVVAIAWGLMPEPTRGPSRGVTLDEIVDEAIEIADAEGITAVTMARVAKAVGFSTMALYRYVAGKDELLLLMLDAATTLPERLDDCQDWRSAVEHWIDLLRDVYWRHPWVLDVPKGPVSVLMPGSMRAADFGMRALAGLRLDDQERIAFILSASAYVSAFVGIERDLAGQDDVVLGPEAMAKLATVITPERLPGIAPMLLRGEYVGGPPDAGESPENVLAFEFRWGLNRLLDGLAQLHQSRTDREP